MPPAPVQRAVVVQHQGELMQLLVAKALRLDRFYGGQHVVSVVAGTAVPLQHVVQLFGERQPSDTHARTLSFPPISPRDIIVESENRRWRVVNVVTTQRLRAVVHQELQLHEIARSDIEYSLPLALDATQVRPAASRNFSNPQNLSQDADKDVDIFAFWGVRR